MAQKTSKIDDVKGPGKSAPSASGRPIVVTNRPMLANDPMMVENDDTPPAEKAKPAEPISRTAKTLKPVDETLKAPAPEVKPTDSADTAAEAAPEPATDEPAETTVEDAGENRDADAAASAADAEAEAAKLARETELEQLITSGKYAVPINAVQKKRSHMYTVLLCVVALILVVVLADAALDAGLIKLSGVPHTHFFGS